MSIHFLVVSTKMNEAAEEKKKILGCNGIVLEDEVIIKKRAKKTVLLQGQSQMRIEQVVQWVVLQGRG